MWKTLLNQAPKKEIYVSENKEIKGEAHHEIIFPSKMLYYIVTDRVPETRVLSLGSAMEKFFGIFDDFSKWRSVPKVM